MVVLCFAGLLSAQSYLPDGAVINIGNEYLEENIVRPGDLTDLLEGTISYDPVNHVLTLTDVLIESSKQVALGMTCTNMEEGSKQIEVRVVGNNIVRSTYSSGYGLVLGVGSFVITGMNGSLKLMSNDGFGMYDWADELTIKDGVWVYAGYSETGCKTAYGATGSGVMNINCAKFYAYGTDVTMYGLNPSLNHAVETQGYIYNSSLEEWTEDGTNVLKDKPIMFAPTEHDHVFTWINANPEGGTISVTKDGNPLSNPYYYGQDEENVWVDILATPNEGWEFVAWRAFNGAFWNASMAETTYGFPESVQTGMIIGFFRKTQHPAPSKPWYLLSEYYEKIVSIDDWSKSPATVSESFLSDMQATKLKFATFAEGRLYFIDQEDTDKSGLYSVQFDPSTGKMSDVQMHFNAQDTYQKFYCLTYDYTEGFLYGIALKSDNEQYLVKINLKTNGISSVGKITNTSVLNSRGVWMMAATPEGELYGIFKVGETHNGENSPFRHGSMLCKIDKTNASISPVGWTGEFFESPSLSMACDYKTGELIATSYSNISSIVSIDKKTGKATPLQGYTSYCNGLFQLLMPIHPVEMKVKSGQEDMGTVVLLETGKTEGKYMEGDEYDIEAFPKTSEYRFIQWNDGVTDNPRTIKMGTDASYTWTAEFDYAEGVEKYPIWVGKKQLTSLTGTLTNAELADIKGGSISFDAETNTLTLDHLDLQYYQSDPAISIVGEESNPVNLTIHLIDDNTIVGTPYPTGTLAASFANITIAGSGTLDVSVLSTLQPGVLLEHANLSIEGTKVKISGIGSALMALAGDEVLTVRGADVQFNNAVEGLDSISLEYCDITTPAGAKYDKENHYVAESGSKVTSQIKITPWPQVRCEPEEEGTGSFRLSAEGVEPFTNIGWFKSGTDVTITAVPEDGFEFARWKDDMLWGDETKQDQWIGEERKIEGISAGIDYKAVFYYSPSSDKVWYGVNDDKFISFEMIDRAAHKQVSKSSAANVKAGDFRDGNWEIIENTSLKAIPFGGVVDNEDLPGLDDAEEVMKNLTVDFKDMAYDLNSGDVYGVNASSLYRFNYGVEKEEDQLTKYDIVDKEDNSYTAVSIAINSSSEIYILEPGDPAHLYRVVEFKDGDKKVVVEPVGEDKGNIHQKVENLSQSIAFDLASDELFWGAKDYLRVINTETAQTFICGDLDRQKGAQGRIKAMHCENQFATVSVSVAKECKGMGKVSISSAGYGSGVLIEGKPTTFTIKAEPEEGYVFLYWKQGKKEIEEETYKVTTSLGISFVAYFEEEETPNPHHGLDDVQADKIPCSKVLIDGELYIINGNKIFNATGIRVK